jgi:hypothetical protein
MNPVANQRRNLVLARVLTILILLVSAPEALWSQRDPLALLAGTWKLKAADSKYDAVEPLQSQIHKWELIGKDMMKHTADAVLADGTTRHVEETCVFDVEKAILSSQRADSLLDRRVNTRTTVARTTFAKAT